MVEYIERAAVEEMLENAQIITGAEWTKKTKRKYQKRLDKFAKVWYNVSVRRK